METDMAHVFDWVIMIYFGGDNNLAEEMIWSIKDIQAWRSKNPQANIKVCVLFDGGGPPVPINDDKLVVYRPADLHPSADDPKHPDPASANGASPNDAILTAANAERRRVNKDNIPSVKQTLERFIKKILGEFDSRHYMLVLAGHGSGAVG